MKHSAYLCALVLLICSASAWGAVGDYIIRDDQVYRVAGGRQTLVEDAAFDSAKTDAGLWSWLLVDPDLSDGMKGSQSGVYFFRGEEHVPASFLPMEHAGACMMEFSPSGEKLLICHGEEVRQDLGYYVLEEAAQGFVKKSSFVSAGHAFWVDPHRFVFTMIDAKKGPRSKAGDDWWCSAAMYDSVENELIVIKKATAVNDYIISGVDHEGGTLDITESSVKNPKDWGSENRIKYREFTVPIPAAG